MAELRKVLSKTCPTRFLGDRYGRRREVGQGIFAIGDEQNLVLTATLGSCVGVFLHDPTGRIGGMTHIFRCIDPGPLGGAAVVAEIEKLVNALMRAGVPRSMLVARLAGGAKTLARGRDVGAQIADFCLDFLLTESIPILEHDLGGHRARRVQFRPSTGELDIKYPGVSMVEDTALPDIPPFPDAEIF